MSSTTGRSSSPTPPRIPRSPRSSTIGSRRTPKLKIIVSNDCGADKFITVRYEGGRNVILKPPREEKHTIRKDEKDWVEILHPEFDLARPGNGNISVQWSIEDHNQRKLAIDTIRSKILASPSLGTFSGLRKVEAQSRWKKAFF